jgi:DNA polymerase IV
MFLKIILHIDMNSYFASVEQQANPFLRGRPVGVCAYLSPGGCIIASSREAKKLGVKTGCTVRDAERLAPGIVFLENEPAKYRSTTEKIFNIFSEYTDTVEPYSIDEAFLDLSETVKDFNEATIIAQKIQKRIKDEVGEWLGSSVGISWTKFLAKFGSDIAPKGGCLVVDKNNLDILLNRPLIDAWGIGDRMAERLSYLGISTLLELKKYSPDKLKRLFGRYGYYLWANVNGEEITSVNSGVSAPKSVGHSYCIPNKTKDKKYLEAIFYKLTEKTGRRLRALDMEAQRIMIGVAYVREGGIYKVFKTPEKMFTTEEIYKYIDRFLQKTEILMPARMLAVSVGLLTPVSGQMSLLDNNLEKKQLSRALDRINDKYGEHTVIRGAMFGAGDMARDRIGFRKVN